MARAALQLADSGALSHEVQVDLRARGAILLVSCYELGHQPMGIASPMGFLERAGYAPQALDLSVETFDAKLVADARLVGISVPMHTALRLGVQVAAAVRQANPGCHIVFYGLYATLNGAYLLEHVADSVVGGEVEGPLLALAHALEAGETGAVTGVWQRGQPRVGPHLARLPFAVPSRTGLPDLDGYARLRHRGREVPAGYVEASRGCRYGCLHCPIPPVYGGRFFVVPANVVLEDIGRQVAAGARHVTFGDPDFFNGPRHVLRIVRDMHAAFPDLTFDLTTKVSHILRHRDRFPELAELGCLFCVSAVESLSDTVLARLEKGHTRAEVFEALRIVRGAGIALRPSLLAFTPWTTLDDVLEVLEWVAAEDLIDHVDPVQYAVRLLVPPGSALLGRRAIHRFLGPLDPAAFTYRWTHPDPRMDALWAELGAAVAQAADAGEDPRTTFQRVRSIVHRFAGRRPPPRPRLRHGHAPPRLTEAWFC